MKTPEWKTRTAVACLVTGLSLGVSTGGALLSGGCVPGSESGVPIEFVNPFQDLPPIALDGRPRTIDYDVVPLGQFERGDVFRLEADGPAVTSVMVLAEDAERDDIGRLAGGGDPGEPFDYRVQVPGRYFAFVVFDPEVLPSRRWATLAAERGDPTFMPPATQAVRVVFEPDYLTGPGLVDPTSFTEEEIQVLVDISDLVREGVLERLRILFENTPIQILSEDDPLPEEPYSTLTFSPERRIPEPNETWDAFETPPLLAEQAECTDVVVFGEMLPRGTLLDPGNQNRSDEAVVYVGSFQGRGRACRTAVIDSINNIVLGLAQTGAHEIGHLIGLYHVPLADIMNRSPSAAFQRELEMGRGQILLEASGDLTRLLTNVLQDPPFYFVANFQQ